MDRPGFSFCICPDWELTRQHIDSLLEGTGEVWRRQTFWADEELPDGLWQALTGSGLLGEHRAVVLRRTETLSAASWAKFHGILSTYRPTIWPFFCLEKAWSRGKPDIPAALKKQTFWAVAEKRGWVWTSPGLTRQSLPATLRQWASERGMAMSEQAVHTAGSLLPLDASALKNELDKLELWTAGKGSVEPEDLGIVAFQPDMDIFAFLTALQSGGEDVQIWRKVLRSQLEADADTVLPFLGLMLREARILWQLSSGEEGSVWLPARVKAAKRSLAQRLGRDRLAELWTLILEAETNIKSGEQTPGQAFEVLTLRLVELFGS